MHSNNKFKAQNFLDAELDPLNSTYKMLMYREQFPHPNTYYSKKKDFEEVQDKEYLLFSMIERFIGRHNCFFRKSEHRNGKDYTPALMIEFWRIFQDDLEERLVLRMFHPTKHRQNFLLFDYFAENLWAKSRLMQYYELMRVGKTEAIAASRPRRLAQDEKTDFTWKQFPTMEDWTNHLARLYSKYPNRGRIDIYKEAYEKRHFSIGETNKSIETNSTSAINLFAHEEDFSLSEGRFEKYEDLVEFCKIKIEKYPRVQVEDFYKIYNNLYFGNRK